VSGISTLFDREGLAGPWMLCKSGQIVSTESGQVLSPPKSGNAPPQINFGTAQISKDGNQVMVFASPGTKGRAPARVFDLAQKSWLDSPYSFLLFNQNPALPTRNIYRAIESVALYQNGVALRGRKARWRKIALDQHGKLCIQNLPANPAVSAESIFGEHQKTKYGCTLRFAEVAGGNKMFLDSRGLLHFKHSNPDVPEVSILLADGEVAGWTSDGRVCGPQFFFDGPIVCDSQGVFERIMTFFTKL